MRSPKVVLENLAKHSGNAEYKYGRLYRNLFNEEFFLAAYQRIYAKPGNMTPGTDKKTIDGMSLGHVHDIIGRLQDCSYQPKPVRRKYIPKKNGKMRPLGIPSFEDKLVQEVVRMILESIYEGTFQSTSHGFRPHKSCHTALRSIKTLFTGAKWFVEGDITGFFDNIHHATLINILRKRIADERFINLIEKFLKAGYLEDWQRHTAGRHHQPHLVKYIPERTGQVYEHVQKRILHRGKAQKEPRIQGSFQKVVRGTQFTSCTLETPV